MNEPEPHIEIEDVLTSIRRLVSQDAGTARGSVMPHRAAPPAVELSPQPEPDVAADEAPCLVLTPALRVEPAEAEADVPVVPEADGDIGEELSRLENSIAEMEAAVAGHETDFGAERTAEDVSGSDAEDLSALVSAEVPPAEPRDDVEEIEAPFAEDVVPEELEALRLDLGAQESAGYEDEAAELHEELEAAEEATLAANLDEAVEAEDEGDPDLHDDAWTEDQGAMDWTEAALNLASTVGQGPRRLHLSDAIEDDRKPEILRSSYQTLRDEYARDEDLPGIEAALDDEPIMDPGLIDEEALRDLVAQLIREELRGVLGERITRNVRKLVRREIQRALMGEDYE